MAQYPGHKTRESFGYTDKNGWTVKGWAAWMEYREALYAWWAFIAKRRYHALPEDKGIPVPHTGKRNRRKWENGSGVSASSRVLSHYYADEGDKGRWVRKIVRNRERAMWQRDWADEQNYDAYDAETVAQWFYDNSGDVDSDIIPSVYTVGETVVEWPNDYYDEYGYADTYGCGDPYCDICGTGYEEYEDDPYYDFCGHCGGPCEL